MIGGVNQFGKANLSILRGANLAELPVQQPTKYELLINLRTASAADEVIE